MSKPIPLTSLAGTAIAAVLILAGPQSASGQVPAACGDEPRLECRKSEKSGFALKQPGGKGNKLTWKWIKGAATSAADLGDPTAAAEYALCLYAGGRTVATVGTAIPAGAAWKALGAKGYKYSEKSALPDGVAKVLLKAGEEGKTKIIVKGKGAAIPVAALPADAPLLVQLVNSENANCFEDIYAGADLLTSDATEIKAKAGPEDLLVQPAVIKPAAPLPAQTAAEAGVPEFVGAPATAAPMAPLILPEHPYLAPQGDSRIHNDAENSAVYNRDGPLGINPTITTASMLETGDIVSVCAMSAFTAEGLLVTSCIRLATQPSVFGQTRLVALDPVTLDTLAVAPVAERPIVQNSAGGAYFSIDNNGRFVIGAPNNSIEIWELNRAGGVAVFMRRQGWDVSGVLAPGDLLQDTVADWEGNIWFASTQGIVGFVDPNDGSVETFDIAEGLQNSFAVDASGVYIVSYDAMYKFSVAGDGSVQQDWRTPYDNTGEGLTQPGSGTTPTLHGSLGDLVSFGDTALPKINMVILDRTTGAEVCVTPIFRDNESGAENTFATYGDEVIIPNNAGFTSSFGPQNTVEPGLERYSVRGDRTGCDPVWVNDTSIGNSAQMSTTTGLIYGWGPDPDVTGFDAYYFTANDYTTGDEVYRVYAGDGRPFNPVLGQPHLGPDGAAYVGTLEGFIRIADGD